MCRERQISRALYWWDVGCGPAAAVEGAGQGREGQGMAWHGGMATEERIDLVLARRAMAHGEVSRT